MTALVDEIGHRHGSLTVIERAGARDNGPVLWRCRCDCGNETILSGVRLRAGESKSCGCGRIKFLYKPYGVAARNDKLKEIKDSAKRRGYCWALSDEEAITIMQENCHYCGSPPKAIKRGRGKNGDFIYNGIDRLDNNLGYISDNVVPCCYLCNSAKGTLSVEEFFGLVERISRHQFVHQQGGVSD